MNAGCVFTTNCAMEITNRSVGIELDAFMSDKLPLPDYARRFLMWDNQKLDDDDGRNLEVAEYVWHAHDPFAFMIPGTATEKATRFEAQVYAFFFAPVIKAWDARTHDCHRVRIIELEKMLLEQPGSLKTVQVTACSEAVFSVRALLHIVTPDDVKYKAAYDKMANMQARSGPWPGLTYQIWQILREASYFKPLIGSIRRTQMTHEKALDNATALKQRLDEYMTVADGIGVLEPYLHNLGKWRSDARLHALDFLERDVVMFAGQVDAELVAHMKNIEGQRVDAERQVLLEAIVLNKKFMEGLLDSKFVAFNVGWKKNLEKVRENLPRWQSQMNRIVFAPYLAALTFDGLRDGGLDTFKSKLMEMLTSEDEERKFSEEIVVNMRRLFNAVFEAVTTTGLDPWKSDAMNFENVLQMMLDFLPLSHLEETKKTMILRSVIAANDMYSNYLWDPVEVLTPFTRAQKDENQQSIKAVAATVAKLESELDSFSLAELSAAQRAPVRQLITDMHKLIMEDAPEHLEAIKKRYKDFLLQPYDASTTPPRSVQDVMGGALDGSDWHAGLKDDINFKKLHEVAKQTVLTLVPGSVRKAAVSLSCLASEGEDTMTRFKISEESSPTKVKDINDAAVLCARTHREATIVALMMKHKADESQLKKFMASEERVSKTANAVPAVWESVHKGIKNLMAKAKNLEGL